MAVTLTTTSPIPAAVQEELRKFDDWIRQNYGGGLTKIEKMAVSSYLHQKLKGVLDPAPPGGPLLEKPA